NYFIDEATFEYLLRAVELIAEHGWRLLPYYEFEQSTATWRFQGQTMQLGQPLAQIDFSEESREQAFTPDKAIGSDELAALLREAEATLARMGEAADAGATELNTYRLTLPASVNALRWFALPQEVSAHLFGESENKGEAAA
ncbi:MAG: hypothetical protein P1V29_06330, partial [Gammaproteobacteria bacterium]|nr:hypothetical protein [Gammaproteobacteria bacterium]